MSFRAEEILDLLERRSARGLISAETFVHIKSVGRLLPNGITYGFGFETRLADPAREVDFILRPMAPLGLAIIAGLDTSQPLPIVLSQDRNWLRLRALCSAWAAQGSPLGKAIFCLWIEFDSEQLRHSVPSPSLVFAQLRRPYCSPGTLRAYCPIYPHVLEGMRHAACSYGEPPSMHRADAGERHDNSIRTFDCPPVPRF